MKDKILLIIPKFYGYEDIIVNEVKKNYKHVYMIYENRDWVSLWHRFVYVYMSSKKRKVLDRFYFDEINKLPSDIDTVLTIRGSSLSSQILDYMRRYFQPNCKYIMYQWDGVKNNLEILDFIDHFDGIYTFDSEDSKKYGWKYRPLFFDKSLVENRDKVIDIAFLCSLHSQRAKVLQNLQNICSTYDYKFFSHMYCNKFAYFKWKYIGRKSEFINTQDRDVAFKSLSLLETYRVYAQSKIVIDYTHPNQTGFTMRTIEALGNKCKLITNNKHILDADFYNPNNIFVYDGADVSIPESFIMTPYIDIDKDLYDYYSIEGWLRTLDGDN